MSLQGVQAVGPARAIVTPRGSPASGGEVLPLEKYIRDLFQSHPFIAIVGPSGSGKTTAVRHLAHELGHLPITFLDGEPDASFVTSNSIVFSCTTYSRNRQPSLVLNLAPWTESERVDYLLAKHPAHIRSIMNRLEQCDCIDDLEGSPRLWTAVLDWMARKPEDHDVREFLRLMTNVVLDMFGEGANTARRTLASSAAVGERLYDAIPAVLQHPFVARLTLADLLVQSIGAKEPNPDWWRLALEPSVLREAARLIRDNPLKAAALEAKLDTCPEAHVSTTMNLMLMVNPNYRPHRLLRNLRGVRAQDVRWVGVVLPAADMSNADFRCADLSGSDLRAVIAVLAQLARADLSDAQLEAANFSKANCRETTFRNANLDIALFLNTIAHAADFNGASLNRASLHADLLGASFVGARLKGANFSGATLDATDFTGADLSEAILSNQRLNNAILDQVTAHRTSFASANLEGMTIQRLSAPAASFTRAELTGLRLVNADLRNANFRSAGLADIDWENANLHNANFDNAAFHMGSSRSGLVDSPIACEGSRTGFYTDDAAESYRHPEEIRKANLCGADLTGASVEKTDWYLVDLRGARYSTQQAMWFRKCGAILFDRH